MLTVDVNPETDEEKMARFETALLNELRVHKHRQVIHPVLQEGEYTTGIVLQVVISFIK